MILRAHQKGDAASEAVYSACERYRYSLTRVWGTGPKALFILLNPSTATEMQNDPTIERCERRARALGFGAFRVVNIFAFRATDPRDMRSVDDPIGPDNDTAVLQAAAWARLILCGWGGHGTHLGRGVAVEAMLRQTGAALFHLGFTKDRQPKHPLYIGYAVSPQLWV
jgi:hypothetical protein